MNPKVDAFIERATKWQAEMELCRKLLVECGLTEEVKWGKPCYTFDGANVAGLGPMKEKCVLAFFKGALLKDPKNILVSPGPNSQSARWIDISGVEKISRLKPTIRAYVREAIAIEEAGLKVKFKDISEHPVPEELQQRLDGDPDLKAAFEALTPGRRRAYLLHFSAPKQSKTRFSRIDKCADRILAGKGPNDR